MQILLTGFEPFGSVKVNPSQLIVEHFKAQNRRELIPLVLPTEYRAAGERITNAIRVYSPDVVLSLGVAQNRNAINLERVALNVDDASIPDNAGFAASGEQIDPDGPVAYWSTLPLQVMQAQIAALGIPVVISNHAGAYICNHVFYTARRVIDCDGSAIPSGFIHVPDLQRNNGEMITGLPLETMIQAVEACLQVIGS